MTTHTLTVSRKHLRASLVCVAVKDIRYYLMGVMFEVHPDRYYMVSTDGHRLSVIRNNRGPVCEGPQLPVRQYIIPADTLAQAAKLKHKYCDELSVELSEDAFRLVDVANSTTLEGKPVEGRFPDWLRVIPSSKPSGEAAQFNLGYLADFQKIGVLLGSKFSFPIIHHNGKGAAIAEFPNHPEAFGVVMPLRDEVHAAPDVDAFKQSDEENQRLASERLAAIAKHEADEAAHCAIVAAEVRAAA